jgi:hypothetical protein
VYVAAVRICTVCQLAAIPNLAVFLKNEYHSWQRNV